MLVGEVAGVVNNELFTVRAGAFVHHGGRCDDQIKVILPLQALLHYLHVQQPQEAASEAKPHRR